MTGEGDSTVTGRDVLLIVEEGVDVGAIREKNGKGSAGETTGDDGMVRGGVAMEAFRFPLGVVGGDIEARFVTGA